MSAVTVPLFVFLMVVAPKVIFVWMGLGYGRSILVIRILSFGFLMNTIAQVAAAVCIAIDRPQFMSIASAIIVILSIALSIILVKIFGFLGIAWGSALSVNIGTLYFLANCIKIYRCRLRSFFAISGHILSRQRLLQPYRF